MRIFGAAIDIALGRADGDGANGHAFDKHIGVAFEHHAVGEGAAIALVGIADDIFAVARAVGHRLPFDAGREAGAATAAQARLGDFGDDRGGADFDGAFQAFPAAMRLIVFDRYADR